MVHDSYPTWLYQAIAMENGHRNSWFTVSLNKMVIFHSYNSLPEGKYPTAIMVNLNCLDFSIRIAIRAILKLSYQKSTFVQPTTSLVGIYSYYRFISQRFHASRWSPQIMVGFPNLIFYSKSIDSGPIADDSPMVPPLMWVKHHKPSPISP